MSEEPVPPGPGAHGQSGAHREPTKKRGTLRLGGNRGTADHGGTPTVTGRLILYNAGDGVSGELATVADGLDLCDPERRSSSSTTLCLADFSSTARSSTLWNV
jgi:hypothetical protein